MGEQAMPTDSGHPNEARLDAGQLFRQHGRFVARFASKLGVPPGDLDDLVQSVFVVAHQRGGFVLGDARPTTWLARIALHVASTRRRGQRRRPEQPDSEVIVAIPAGGPLPSEQLETKQGLLRVQAALDSLDLEHRAVFILYELEGESCASIAEGMELPVGTVHSRLHTARKKFIKAHARLVASERWRAAGGSER